MLVNVTQDSRVAAMWDVTILVFVSQALNKGTIPREFHSSGHVCGRVVLTLVECCVVKYARLGRRSLHPRRQRDSRFVLNGQHVVSGNE